MNLSPIIILFIPTTFLIFIGCTFLLESKKLSKETNVVEYIDLDEELVKSTHDTLLHTLSQINQQITIAEMSKQKKLLYIDNLNAIIRTLRSVT